MIICLNILITIGDWQLILSGKYKENLCTNELAGTERLNTVLIILCSSNNTVISLTDTCSGQTGEKHPR